MQQLRATVASIPYQFHQEIKQNHLSVQEYWFYPFYCQIHSYINQFDSFFSQINEFLMIFQQTLNQCVFEPDLNQHHVYNKWMPAKYPSKLRTVKRRVSVNDNDCRSLKDSLRQQNLDSKICWIKYQLLFSHINSSSSSNMISITSCWFSDYSCRRLSINCSTIRIHWIHSSHNCRSKVLLSNSHYIQKQAESIQQSMIWSSTTDWIHSKDSFICLLQNLLQLWSFH